MPARPSSSTRTTGPPRSRRCAPGRRTCPSSARCCRPAPSPSIPTSAPARLPRRPGEDHRDRDRAAGPLGQRAVLGGGGRIPAIGIKQLRLPPPPPFSAAWDPVPRRQFDAALVRVDTDAGLAGYGSGDTMEGFADYAHLFIGEDPLRIARHGRVIAGIAFHARRYWPLEAALWDIAAQACGQSVATLFGGASDKLACYASFGESRTPADRADAVLAAREAGFRAVKIRIGRA